MLSIIIPTINEEIALRMLLPYLHNCCKGNAYEIIIADYKSTDNTKKLTEANGALYFCAPKKSRAAQMNFGAMQAKYSILYFVHADVVPPKSFYNDIVGAVANGFELGRYTTKFERSLWKLKINEWCSRLDWFVCYAGDQTLFVTKNVFELVDGYCEKHLLMEEFDFTKRARAITRYKIFKQPTIISLRKYETNSWWQVQKTNYRIVMAYKKGLEQHKLLALYQQMLHGVK
jgi:rSAM/selenodomain-associated transferase 2